MYGDFSLPDMSYVLGNLLHRPGDIPLVTGGPRLSRELIIQQARPTVYHRDGGTLLLGQPAHEHTLVRPGLAPRYHTAVHWEAGCHHI